MTRPYLSIDLDKIEHNAAAITGLCGRHGIAVAGVTKCVCGHPQVARAMLRGGVDSLADSRLENIERLRGAGIEARCLLLRLPPLSGAAQVVESADWSVNSELEVLQALSNAAVQRRVHEVMLMVDLGDLREGIWPDDLLALAAQAVRLPGIRIVGLGANLACFSGVVPSEHNMQRLVELAEFPVMGSNIVDAETKEVLGAAILGIGGDEVAVCCHRSGPYQPDATVVQVEAVVLVGRRIRLGSGFVGLHGFAAQESVGEVAARSESDDAVGRGHASLLVADHDVGQLWVLHRTLGGGL